MFVSLYLEGHEGGGIASIQHSPKQKPLSTTRDVVSAEFPNSHQVLLSAEPKHNSLRQKYADMLKQGLTAELITAVESQIITREFRSLENQSALAIAFLNQQYEVFVWLKSRGFREFADEGPLEINKLSEIAQHRIEVAICKIRIGLVADMYC